MPIIEALHDITCRCEDGDRVGLVGHNGAGKSTLLRLLSGIYEPTRGRASVRGQVAPVFDLGVGMDPEISGYENIIIRGLFLGHDPQADGGAGRRHRRVHRARRLPADAAAHLLDRHAGPARARRGHQHRPGDPAARRGHRRRRRGVPEKARDAAATSWWSAPACWCSPRTPTSSSRELCDTAIWMDHGTIKQQGALREVLQPYKGRDVWRARREPARSSCGPPSRKRDERVTRARSDGRSPSSSPATAPELLRRLADGARRRRPGRLDHLVVVDNGPDEPVARRRRGLRAAGHLPAVAAQPRRRRRLRARHAARARAGRGLGVAAPTTTGGPPTRRAGHPARRRRSGATWPRSRRWSPTSTTPTGWRSRCAAG